MKRKQEFFRGCLLGGAIGDALGWPIEFTEYDEIIEEFGEDGINDLVLSKSGKAEITDDTQMTLFTAEGIIRAQTRGNEKGICDPISVVYFAYKRWLNTQGYKREKDYEWIYDGWLLDIKELHAKRAPGNSCLSALCSNKMGSIDDPINDSKGCGGVMRVAPVGLFYSKERAFEMGADFAALTHGHPSGYLSAGALSLIISCIINGRDIETSVNETLDELKKHKNHEECYELLKKAVDLSYSDIKPLYAINELGEGWVGEEALAISVYCALKYKDDFKKALITSVNHNGDSDSTGSITGNILGAYLGINEIPKDLIDNVELSDEISQVADDLLTGYERGREWWNRYPGY
jgi:ADP-ribosylglycohydrolase